MAMHNRPGRQARPVDWTEWRHAHHVKLIEAVALSLGIDPNQVRLHPHGWMAAPGAVIADEGDEFAKRLRVAGRALGNELDLATVVMGAPERCGVFLAQFAGWVRDVVRWDAPAEFVALAGVRDESAEPSQPVASSAPAPLSSGDMAALLAGIERSEADWKDKLADPPKWLMAARVSRGAPGRAPASWNPVAVAQALQGRRVPDSKLRAIFANQLASHWAEEWARVNQTASDYGI